MSKYIPVQYNSREEALAAWNAARQRKLEWLEAAQEEFREIRRTASVQLA